MKLLCHKYCIVLFMSLDIKIKNIYVNFDFDKLKLMSEMFNNILHCYF